MNLALKLGIAGLIAMMAIIFVWQPLSLPYRDVTIINDFVLPSAGGPVDSKSLRGKVLMIVFGYGHCAGPCRERVAASLKPYELLNLSEKRLVRPIMISVDPERDTPQAIDAFARSIHPDLVGVTGRPDEISTLAEKFSARYARQQVPNPDGSYIVEFLPQIHLVDPEGRFVTVLHPGLAPEKAAQSIRSRIPATLPPQ